jgi:hypothetical protein
MTVAADLLPVEITTLVVEAISFFKTKTQIGTHHPVYHCRTKHNPSVDPTWLAQAVSKYGALLFGVHRIA